MDLKLKDKVGMITGAAGGGVGLYYGLGAGIVMLGTGFSAAIPFAVLGALAAGGLGYFVTDQVSDDSKDSD
jgi:hypothetical protein